MRFDFQKTLTKNAYWAIWIGHSVKRSHSQRILVQHEKVSSVLLLDKFAQQFLVRCAQVLFVGHFNAVLVENLNSLAVLQAQSRLQKLERLAWILSANSFDLLRVSLFKKQFMKSQNEIQFCRINNYLCSSPLKMLVNKLPKISITSW